MLVCHLHYSLLYPCLRPSLDLEPKLGPSPSGSPSPAPLTQERVPLPTPLLLPLLCCHPGRAELLSLMMHDLACAPQRAPATFSGGGSSSSSSSNQLPVAVSLLQALALTCQQQMLSSSSSPPSSLPPSRSDSTLPLPSPGFSAPHLPSPSSSLPPSPSPSPPHLDHVFQDLLYALLSAMWRHPSSTALVATLARVSAHTGPMQWRYLCGAVEQHMAGMLGVGSPASYSPLGLEAQDWRSTVAVNAPSATAIATATGLEGGRPCGSMSSGNVAMGHESPVQPVSTSASAADGAGGGVVVGALPRRVPPPARPCFTC